MGKSRGAWFDVQRLHSLSDRAALALWVYKAQIMFSLWKKTSSVQALLAARGQVWLLQAGDMAGVCFRLEQTPDKRVTQGPAKPSCCLYFVCPGPQMWGKSWEKLGDGLDSDCSEAQTAQRLLWMCTKAWSRVAKWELESQIHRGMQRLLQSYLRHLQEMPGVIPHLQRPLPFPFWGLCGLSWPCRRTWGPFPRVPRVVAADARQQPLPSPEARPWQLRCLGYSGNKLQADSTKQLNSAPCSSTKMLSLKASPSTTLLLNHPDTHGDVQELGCGAVPQSCVLIGATTPCPSCLEASDPQGSGEKKEIWGGDSAREAGDGSRG